jgi:HK97 family phage prohead protease
VLRFDDSSPDARTINVCIASYGDVAVVDDGAGPYMEKFLSGVFREQVEAARTAPLRIWLHLEHRRGNDNVIGHAVRLRDLPGGLYGSFRVHAGVVGDKVLTAVREGVLTGVSMQVAALRSRTVDGVMQRQKAHLAGVALVPEPAYPSAKVFAVSKALRDDQAGPASMAEFSLWELDRLDGKLRALACSYLDDALEMRAERRHSIGAARSYASDPRYQRVLQLRQRLAETRAGIELATANGDVPEAAAEPEALQPKVLRRVLSGPIAIR